MSRQFDQLAADLDRGEIDNAAHRGMDLLHRPAEPQCGVLEDVVALLPPRHRQIAPTHLARERLERSHPMESSSSRTVLSPARRQTSRSRIWVVEWDASAMEFVR
jgi:hypothetical protein